MRLLILIFLITLYIPSFAYELKPIFKNFGVNDGLPSSQVFQIIEDDYGYIWFGTDGGLVKYNGYEFKTYTLKNGLSSNVIFKLDLDSKGRICCYGSDRKIYFLEDEQFIEYRFNDSILKNLSTNSHLLSFDFYKGGVEFNSTDRLENVNVFARVSDNGELHYINQQGIHIESHTRTSISCKNMKAFQPEYRLPFYYNGKLIDSLDVKISANYFANAEKSGDRIYFSINSILYSFNPESNEINYLHNFDEEILDLTFDKKGNLFIATRFRGLWKTNLNYPIYYENIIANRSVSSVFIDKNDGLWAATLYHGIYYCSNLNNYVFLSDRNPMRFYECDSSLYILSEFEELFSVDLQETIAGNERDFLRVSYKNFQDIKTSGGVNYDFIEFGILFSREKTKYMSIHLSAKDYFLLPSRYAIIARDGVKFYSQENDTLKNANVIMSSFVNCGQIYDSERLILGTENGVVLIDNDGYKPQRTDFVVKNDPKNLQNYRSDIPFFRSKITDILNFGDSIRVFASSGNGLLIEKNGYKNRWLSKKDGLISDEIDRVYYKNKQLVLLTKKGVSVLSEVGGIRNYTTKNGILSNNVKDAAIVGDRIWIATDQGTSILKRTYGNISDIPIYLTQLDVNLAPISLENEIILDYQQNLIGIHFEGLTFAQDGNITYKYQLKGVDPTWINTTSRTVRYANLPYGDYEFWISAKKQDETWTSPQRLLSISRQAPFWETNTFYVFCILITIILIWFIFQLRYRRLKREQADKLQVLNLERKTLQAQMNPHFVFNSLTSLQSLILDDKKLESQEYLAKFAKLTRQALNQSTSNAITLIDEIDNLTLYIQLECIRFDYSFNFEIQDHVHEPTIEIPPMVVQPFVENAIKHGLAGKETGGILKVVFTRIDSKTLLCIVEDNGRGRSTTKISPQKKKSLGIQLVTRRLAITHANLEEEPVQFDDLFDANNNPIGTRVKIIIPITKFY